MGLVGYDMMKINKWKWRLMSVHSLYNLRITYILKCEKQDMHVVIKWVTSGYQDIRISGNLI